MIVDPIKSVHANVGLLNILFTPGSSGTFLANMLSQAIRDPWWEDYVPKPTSEIFRVTNEFLNPFNHIAMTWHPINILETDDVFNYSGVNWVNLTITPAEAKFTKVLWAIKRQTFTGVKKQDILRRLSNDSVEEYQGMCARQGRVSSKLAIKNNVLNVKFSDIFVDGNTDEILSILNILFKGQYVATNVVNNIATQCIAKHKVDIKLHDELLDENGGDGLIDYILSQV